MAHDMSSAFMHFTSKNNYINVNINVKMQKRFFMAFSWGIQLYQGSICQGKGMILYAKERAGQVSRTCGTSIAWLPSLPGTLSTSALSAHNQLSGMYSHSTWIPLRKVKPPVIFVPTAHVLPYLAGQFPHSIDLRILWCAPFTRIGGSLFPITATIWEHFWWGPPATHLASHGPTMSPKYNVSCLQHSMMLCSWCHRFLSLYKLCILLQKWTESDMST